MTNRKELKIYRLVDRIMEYGKGRVRYEDAVAAATKFYNHKPLFWGWGTHVGIDYVALEYSKSLAK